MVGLDPQLPSSIAAIIAIIGVYRIRPITQVSGYTNQL